MMMTRPCAVLVAMLAVSSLPRATLSSATSKIVQTATDNGSFTTLVAALNKANLVETLNGDGPFTVFAPTDAAFDALLTELSITKEQLLARTDLADILKFHVASGKKLKADLTDGLKVTTLQSQVNLGKELTVTVDGTTVKIGDATVATPDLDCTNGVIHVIDKVLMPVKNNVVQTAIQEGSFTTLAAALNKAYLTDVLSGKGPFTVFAPTDAAFEALLTELSITKEQLLARTDLADILKFHVASGKTLSTDLTNGLKVTTLQSQANLGKELTVTIDGTTVKIGDAKVTTADLDCSNGVIHVIDKVLMPVKNNVVQTAIQEGSFTTLAAALTKANLTDTLSAVGPFTVFAPTDAAFEKALKALKITKEQLLAKKDLADILKFHVANGKTMSTSLKNGMEVATLQGEKLKVAIDDSGAVKVNGANVTQADIEGNNGVIHIIDAVLLPTGAKSDGMDVGAAAPRVGNIGLVAVSLVSMLTMLKVV